LIGAADKGKHKRAKATLLVSVQNTTLYNQRKTLEHDTIG
jgi:hypothetical protein